MLKYKTIIACGLSGAIFSVVGALATQYASDEFLMWALGIVLVIFAIMIYVENRRKNREAKERQSLREKAFYTTLIGAIAGFASGFLGIGGGVILVPLLAKLRKLTYKQAIPCSLAIMLIYLIPASITHFTLGNVDLTLFVALFGGSVLGAWIGAKNITRMGEREVRKWFAITLIFFGLLVLLHKIGIIP